MDDRDLNVQVAEKIMEWRTWWSHGDGFYLYSTSGENSLPLPAFSTDIAAAWQIVEWLHERKIVVIVSNGNGDSHDCDIILGSPHDVDTLSGVHVTADSWPRAICLAALKAVGVERNDK